MSTVSIRNAAIALPARLFGSAASRSGAAMATVIITSLCVVWPAHAQVTQYGLSFFLNEKQTSVNAPVAPFNASDTFVLEEPNQNTFTSASVTYPGPGSPSTFAPLRPGRNGIFFSDTNIGSAASLALLQNQTPFGTYTLNASDPQTSASQNIPQIYNANYFPNIPALSASSFTELNQIDPSAPFVVNFNSVGASPNVQAAVTSQEIFLTLTNLVTHTSDSIVVPSANAQGALIPGNSLLPNSAYSLSLEYANVVRFPRQRWRAWS